MYEPNQYVMNWHSRPNCRSYSLQQSYQSQPQQRRRNRPSRPSHSWWQHGHPRHLSLRYHPPDLHITPQIYISYEICGARRCSILHTPSGAVTLYRPFLSILIQKMEIGDGDYKEMWSSPCSIQPQGLGGTQGTPYKYIGLGYW